VLGTWVLGRREGAKEFLLLAEAVEKLRPEAVF